MLNPRSEEQLTPPIEPALQSKLVQKFGAKLMKRGFTALPVLVQDYYRYVPGNVLPVRDEINIFTGEVETIYATMYMTPIEFAFMSAIWSFWWADKHHAWPSVRTLCDKMKKSERQVRRYLQRLRDKGFLICLEQYNSEGKQISSRYDFSPFLQRLISYLDTLKEPQKRPHREGVDDISDRERMSDSAESGCHFWQANQKKIETNTFKEIDSNSSGYAANEKGTGEPPSPKGVPPATIGSTNEETNVSPTIESHRNSNLSPRSNAPAAASAVKEVEKNKNSKKPLTWEVFAQASGISAEQLEEMDAWLTSCPRPLRVPALVQEEIDRVSARYNNGHLSVQNRTQATKLYQYMLAHGYEEEHLHQYFPALVQAVVRRVPPQVSKPMAWFFKALKIDVLKAVLTLQEYLPDLPENQTSLVTEDIVAPTPATPVPVQEDQVVAPEEPIQEQSGDEGAQAARVHRIQTDDPHHGWSYGSAAHFAEKVREMMDGGSSSWRYDIRPTLCEDRYGFVLISYATGEETQEYVTNKAVLAALKPRRREP